ncbi:DUF4427 domain-containing protein [Sphingomonas sp. NPDC019816]|uniref:DUF4427 domain-containing protein n=1 Tax=Sphingomonas sp. NPDC019816 TaxID=3390679 RepID=UPI003CFFC269
MRNNRRYDLSDRLIHIFRDLDLSHDDAPQTPQWWGYGSRDDDDKLSAHFLQRHAIRQGRLWATWSFRTTGRTIYGPRPAVCFTEMPIAAFIETALARNLRGEAISPFAIVLPKRALFQIGARPVIYGLTGTPPPAKVEVDGARMLPDGVLPRHEQYRYAAFDGHQGRPDWSHEREWRWPLQGRAWRDPDGLPPAHSDDLPGLDLDHPDMAGLGVIVANQEQARWVVGDILTKVDRGDIAADHYEFVLAYETISDWRELRDYEKMQRKVAEYAIDLAPFFAMSEKRARARIAKLDAWFVKAHKKASRKHCGGDLPCGKCWLWIGGNQHPLVRALVAMGRITVSTDGFYLIEVSSGSGDSSTERQVDAIERVARKLRRRLGLSATSYRVVSGDDPEGVRYFGDTLDDDFIYNSSGVGTGSLDSSVF